jgi:hypothetical protein
MIVIPYIIKAYPRQKFFFLRNAGGFRFPLSVFFLLFLAGVLSPLPGLDKTAVFFGNFFFGANTKVLENGVPIDLSVGYRYTPSSEGEFRFRRLKESYNDRLYEDIEESLAATDEETWEFFLLPFRYHPVNNDWFKFNLAGGVYYEYNKLNQNGFFNMPVLGSDVVNTYLNNFSMHIWGPLLETGLKFRFDKIVDLRVNAGIVPVFFLRRNQAMKINPYMGTDFFEYSQDTRGSPYVFGEVEGTFFRYVSLALLYEAAWIDYNVITFDSNRAWGTMDQQIVSRTFKIEVSIKLPMGKEETDFRAVLGYGRSYEAVELDSSTPVRDEGQYLIFGGRKEFF